MQNALPAKHHARPQLKDVDSFDCFMELLDNSLDATKGMEAPALSVQALAGAGGTPVALRFYDNGRGMARETLESFLRR